MTKHEFRLFGKTEEDIESQLLEWLKKHPGVVFKRHPIEELPALVRRQGFERKKISPRMAFSMLIEYESKPTGRSRTRWS